MSNYFVRTVKSNSSSDTASDSCVSVPAVFPETDNSVLNYMNGTDADNTHTSVNTPDNSSYTSEGLVFRRLDNSNTVEVIGLAPASASYHTIVVPPVTAIGMSVVKIGNDAFRNALRLRSITLPATVTEIGERAFSGSALESISFLNSLKAIGKDAFSGCTNLVSVSMSSADVDVIEDRTFMNCPSLAEITFPANLRSIGSSCFENCFALHSVKLPQSVVSLGERTFFNCTSLFSFTPGTFLSDIGRDSFSRCISLNKIESPCEFIIDNIATLFSDTPLIKNAQYNHFGVKSVMGVVLDVTKPNYDYYHHELPNSTRVISSYAFLNAPTTTYELPRELRLILPNAFVQMDKVKTLGSDGIVRTSDGPVVKIKLEYPGTVEEWNAIKKIRSAKPCPVVVTCKCKKESFSKEESVTIIDYI